jgi:hypothetical protein
VTSGKQTVWEQFNFQFWQVHDNGHNSCGPTMSNQDIASFDPIFWFFHCNLDRLWLQWQRNVKATTLAGFKSTCKGSTAWIDIPALGVLPPFPEHAADAIILSEVDYAPPPSAGAALMAFENLTGHVPAAKRFRLDGSSTVSIRVKDIDRSGIPGTFVVHLMADGQEVARQAFFQPVEPRVCPNCSENAKVSVELRVPAEAVQGKQLSVELHVPSQKEAGTRFPLSKAGDPTINARLLMQEE